MLLLKACCCCFFLPDLGERVQLPNQLRVVEIVDVIAGSRRLFVLQLNQCHDTHRAVLRAVGVGACVKVPPPCPPKNGSLIKKLLGFSTH